MSDEGSSQEHSSEGGDSQLAVSVDLGGLSETLGVPLEVLKEAYGDLLQPALQSLGQGALLDLARAVNAAFSPFAGIGWLHEQLRQWLPLALLKRFQQTPPEAVQPPRPHIAGPLLLHLVFLQEEDVLREMFADLLASEMDDRMRAGVHPAFVSVLQQLTADEARILRLLSHEPHLVSSLRDGGSLVSPNLRNIQGAFRFLAERAGVEAPDNSPSYLDNLIRLRVFSLETRSSLKEDWPASIRGGAQSLLLPDTTLAVNLEVELTTFGRALVQAVSYDAS